MSEATEEYLGTFSVGVKKASEMLGMSESTLKKSKIKIPHTLTLGGHRRYNLMNLVDVITALTDKKTL